jgi:hypothetical protein
MHGEDDLWTDMPEQKGRESANALPLHAQISMSRRQWCAAPSHTVPHGAPAAAAVCASATTNQNTTATSRTTSVPLQTRVTQTTSLLLLLLRRLSSLLAEALHSSANGARTLALNTAAAAAHLPAVALDPAHEVVLRLRRKPAHSNTQ